MNHEEIIRRVTPYTMTNPVRMQALYESVKQVADIEGDIVETGVCKGGSSMLMAMTLKSLGVTDKKIYMYDTYDGMPEPGLIDNKTNHHGKGIDKWHRTNRGLDWNFATLETVQENVKKTHYPYDKFVFIKGIVEDTIPKTIPEKISILRLDTDFYSSTIHTLRHLFPRVVKGGYIITDDYGAWDGCRKAVDEYFKDNGINKSEIRRVDKSCREYIK